MRFKIFLHNLSHVVLPLLILHSIIMADPHLDITLSYFAVFIGAFLPDIDHLKIWLDYRFKSFWHFFVYSVITDRYRKTVLIFHNIPAVLIIAVIIPLGFIFNLYFGIFVLSFFSHLVLDLLFDWYATKKMSHWKIRRRI
jgi:hypothetical protein